MWAVLDYTGTPMITRELLLVKLSILGPEYLDDQLAGGPSHEPRRPETPPGEQMEALAESFEHAGEHAAAPLGRKLLSLFPGLGYAAGYKVTQRIYKYGGQPWFSDILGKNFRSNFTNAFGERKGKMMMQATAGRWALARHRSFSCAECVYACTA